MTSVVDTSVKFFTSAMLGAPVLNGQVGAGISMLDACLVNGFDLKTATSLVVAGGVATLSFSGSHSALVDAVILVAGSSVSALNGEQKVTAKGSGTVSFATGAADGTASGTVTFKIAPLGWTKVYTGTNKAAYKSADVMSYGMYLRVDDTDAQVMRAVGYETMSDVDTGVGPFPTSSQSSGGLYWGKSFSANTNPVKWAIVGDSRLFFLNMSAYTGQGIGNYDQYTVGAVAGFGDMLASRPQGDPYACAIAGSNSSSWVSYPHYGTFDNTTNDLYVPRNYTGLGTSFPMRSIAYTGQDSTPSGADQTLGTFPSPIDGSLRLSRHFLRSSDSNLGRAPRCDVPGFYRIPQEKVQGQIPYLSTLAGSGDLAGKKLLALNVSTAYGYDPSNTAFGVALFDITGPWR